MALTKATLIDLNSNELILDLDADTSITADTDDTIHFKISGSDEITMTAGAIAPSTADGNALGTSSLEWSDLFLADGGVINLGADQDVTLTHVADTGILLNGAMVIQFRDSGLTIGSNADGDLDIVSDGTAIDSINIESAGGITLDAGTAGSGIAYEDDGTEMLRIYHSSSDVIIQNKVDAKDIVFKQYDGNEVMRIADNRKLYFYDEGGEIISSDGTDFTFNSGNDINLTATTDINIPANVGLTFGDDAEKIEGDGTDLTITGNNINLTATADVNIPSGVGITFATAEKIESDGTDLTITVGSSGDINIGANIGLTFGDDGEKIEGNGTDLTINSSNDLHLTATTDINIPANVGLTFGDDAEKIEGDGTDLTITGNNINLTATADVNIPSGVGITFATGEKLESDGTDLSITVGSGGDINVPANIGLTFGDDGEKIEGDGTDLTISGNNINLTATADVNIPSGVGLTFATGEKLESDGTDLTVTVGSGGDINVGANIGVTFGDDGEKIEGDGTDLTIASSAKINLTATSDVHIPNNVGIVFGGDSEKIEGDGTDMTISANNLTIDAAADVTIDAAGNNIKFASGGTNLLDFANSSSDVIIKPLVDAKDIIIHQYDGTSLVEFNDGGYSKFTSAALNPEATLSDGATPSWNALTEPVAKITIAGNRTIGNASGGVAGAFISLLIIQDGTGSRTMSWNAAYEFKDDTAPTLTTTAAKADLFVFRYHNSKWVEVGRNQNLTVA